MIKITSVLFSLWSCLIFGLYAHAGDFTAVYHNCLKQEREKIQNSVKESCGRESDSSGGAEAEAKCLENGKTIQLSDTANKYCHDHALAASGREPERAAREVPTSETSFLATDVPTPRPAVRAGVAPPTAAPRARPPAATAEEDPPPPPERRTAAPPPPADGKTESPTDLTTTSTEPGLSTTINAEIEADQDIAQCVTLSSGANECCNNPLACSDQLNRSDSNSLGALGAMLGNGAQTGGLSDYCRQMGSLGSNTGNVNSGLASICFGSHASCSTTCGNLAQKYTRLLADCEGCESQSIYENARRSLETNQYTCGNLRSRSDQLAITGLGSANNQAVAEYCNKVAGSPPGSPSAPAAQPRSTSPFINHLLAYNCDANPNGPDCKAMDIKAAAAGTSGFRDETARKNNFNIPDPSTGARGPQTQTNEADPNRGGNLPKVGTVANNTGGQIPGGGSGFQNAAALDPKSKATAGASRLNTDIDGGYQGGGGYSQTVVPQNHDDHGYGGIAPLPNTDRQFENIDLRQFLPGGSRAAMRRLAGSSEINPKEENLFLRITNKIMEKCRLGELWQCR